MEQARCIAQGATAIRPARWDRIGIGLSGLCAVHCLLAPLLLVLLPVLPVAALLHAWLHPVLACLTVPVTAAAARHGYRRHRSRQVLLYFAAGLLLVLTAPAFHAAGDYAETGFTLAGSILLLVGHRRNTCAGHTR